MTGKVQKIREEVERLFNHVKDSDFESDSGAFYYLKDLLDFIDSLQEEPKKCMYTNDNYTDEDRKILCDGCEDDCEYNKKETVNDKLGGINNALVQDRLITSKPIGVPADAIELVSIPDKKEPVAPKVMEDMLNAKTAAKSLGISQEEHDRIVDEIIYGKEPELVDDGDLPKEEPVSEELEKAMQHNAPDNIGIDDLLYWRNGFITGAKWQKEKEYTCYEEAFEDGAKWKVENLWKPADDDDLPEIDREVIALLDNGKVVFAHRPPEYWDGKNIATGKVTRYYPKAYDKGGWNIPNVKYWLDCSTPKEIEL